MAARRDPCRRPVFRGMRLRKQKSRLFCRRRWIYSSSSAPVSPPPVSSSLSALARCCQELLSSFLHRGLGMKGLTGVSLPVARHGGIVSKLLTHGSRALPAKGREEQGQRPEGMGPPCGPRGLTLPLEPAGPGWGRLRSITWGATSQTSVEQTGPRPLPSSQSEWASGSRVGVNPAPPNPQEPVPSGSQSPPPGAAARRLLGHQQVGAGHRAGLAQPAWPPRA